MAHDEIVRQDTALKGNVSCMCSLQSKVIAIHSQTKGGSLRETAGKFADVIRFSTPVSSASLSEIESGLSACVDEIQRAVMDDGSAGAIAFLDRANILLGEELISA